MGQTKVILPPEERKRRLLEAIPPLLEDFLSLIREIREETERDLRNASPGLKNKYYTEDLTKLEEVFLGMREETKEETPLGILQANYDTLQTALQTILSFLEEKEKDYRVETDPETGERRLLEFKSQRPESRGALRELRRLSKTPTPYKIEIPKDLMQSQTHSVGDTLEYITDPKKREAIKKLQEEGKLLAGTLEGLSGGSGYLKSFTIALAQTLNEQSKYYSTDGDFSGVPVSLIPEIFGEGVEVKETYQPLQVHKGGEIKTERRRLPYILVSYEALARKMKGEGKKVGGQDIKYIQEYIQDLSGKQYLLDGGGGAILGIPFLTKTLVIYREDSGKEVGCLLNLSPQFSKSIRGYTTLRGDTLQRIGGGRQKDITMNLLDLLLYVRGVNTKKGGEDKEEDTAPSTFRKDKEGLLSQIATSKRYQRQKGERERDFKEAIQKIKDSGLILGYREESGGRVSVFTFNPNYSKKGGDSPDEQTEG